MGASLAKEKRSARRCSSPEPPRASSNLPSARHSSSGAPPWPPAMSRPTRGAALAVKDPEALAPGTGAGPGPWLAQGLEHIGEVVAAVGGDLDGRHRLLDGHRVEDHLALDGLPHVERDVHPGHLEQRRIVGP